jgi:HEAT repeat protein
MSTPRLLGLGLLVAALGITFTAGSALPQVKLPPQVKPGMPPPLPKPAPPPVDPGKGKNPMPPAPAPGTPSGPGTPSMPGTGKPGEKKEEIKWPDKVSGKTLAEVIKEMKSNSDPAVREAAIRMLPMFGPKGRSEGGQDLVDLMTRDPDLNVRVAAIEVGPSVIWGHLWNTANPVPDTLLQNGLNAMMTSLSHTQMGIRITAVAAVGIIGPYMRVQFPTTILPRLITISKDSSSYHIRRFAATAIGTIGQGTPSGEGADNRTPPDTGAVNALLDIVKNDACALVQREAINALTNLGPVAGSQQKKWRSELEYVIRTEKDKSLVLWTRVCILRNDPAGVDGNPTHMEAVAKVLEGAEPNGRLEACQAMGILGEEAKGKLQSLLSIIENDKEEAPIVIAAIAAVATMKSQIKIIQPILQKIQFSPNRSEEIRKNAAEGIEYLTGRKKA